MTKPTKTNKEKKIKVSLEELEKASLDELWKHCPLCGTKCQDPKCYICGFEWKPGYFYFSNTDLSKWE